MIYNVTCKQQWSDDLLELVSCKELTWWQSPAQPVWDHVPWCPFLASAGVGHSDRRQYFRLCT